MMFSNNWIEYLQEKKQSIINKKENALNDIDIKLSMLDKQISIANGTATIKEYIDLYDFDNDGELSIIDLAVLIYCVQDSFINDPLYDSVNNTYNGKSLDFNYDGKVTITDTSAFIDSLISYLGIHIKLRTYGLSVDECLNIVRDLYESKNGILPTLDELKEFVDIYKENNYQ